MGTSAKYIVEGNTTFYTHYDGYPQGAANRFLTTIEELTKPDPESIDMIKDVRGGFAFAMIRGNADVEPENEMYTDYTYEISKGDDNTYTINYYDVNQILVTQDLANFINNQLEEELVVKVAMLNYLKEPVYTYATKSNAFDIGNLMNKKAETFDDNNINRKIYFEKAKYFLDAVL